MDTGLDSEMMSKPGQWSRNRGTEWATVTVMVGHALCILITPKTLERGAFRHILTIFTPATLGPALLAFGLVRAASLLLNGRMPFYGPLARAIGAGLSAIIWWELFYALVLI